MQFTQDFFFNLIVGKFSNMEVVLAFVEENKKKFDWSSPVVDFCFAHSYKLDSPSILVDFLQKMIEDKVIVPTELMVQTALLNKDNLNFPCSNFAIYGDKILQEKKFHDVILMNTNREMMNVVELNVLKNKERALMFVRGALCPEVITK